MTIDQLVALIAEAKSKGMPGTAVLLYDGAAISPNYVLEYGKYAEGSAETVLTQPSFGLQHLS